MTKQIIINGVDVSRCQYRIGDAPDIHCAISYYWNRVKCSDNPNCYYKQLKRKEQECEKYKNCIDDIKIINKDLIIDLCDNCGWHNTDDCNPDGDYIYESLIKIKQVINEVEQ